MEHSRIVQDIAPGILGYIRNVSEAETHAAECEAWAGVAEFWFEDLNAITALPATDPEGFRRVVDDEDDFLGRVAIENFVTKPASSA